MKSKPNIFSIATGELTQDGFFTWFIQWADEEMGKSNPELNKTAKAFIQYLLQQKNDVSQLNIKTVEAERQWRNIDITVEINKEFAIIIEDKTATGEHSEQLERYKETATEYYQNKNFKLIFIYLKTGNESVKTLRLIESKGYSIIDRRAILKIFSQSKIKNDIFTEFYEYLKVIEEQTASFNKMDNLISNWNAAAGFYLYLQEKIDEESDWSNVSNPMGGFLGFYTHYIEISDYTLYIQIENAFQYGIQLTIRMADWEQNTQMLYKVLSEIQPYAKNNNLILVKPDRFRPGETSNLASVQDAFVIDDKGNIDLKKFLQAFMRLTKTIDDFKADKKT